MGGNGKPAEFLILSNGDIATAQRVFRLNENGLGFSQNGYNGPYETAITYDGHLVADVIAGNKISGVALESTEENLSADLSQVLITGGAININNIYNNTVSTKGRIRYKQQTGIYDTPTLAIEAEHGNNVSIGETDSQKLVYISDPGQDEETFRIYGEVKVFSDMWFPNMYNPDTNGSLLAKLQELEERIEILEQALGIQNP
jgi:phage-related protein